MMKHAATALARVFSIRRGEETKTALLYGMYLAFFVGLRWCDNASYSLFLENWSAGDLALIFAGNALLALMAGLVYSALACKISNERLLLIVIGGMLAWLASVQILLWTPAVSGPRGVAYLYFYLALGALSDIAALHLLNYMNDFYDTRAAKHALPLLVSASVAGAVIAGFSAPALQRIGLQNVPLAWGACLILVLGFAGLIRRRLPGELAQIEQARQSQQAQHMARSSGSSLREGFRLMREWGVLRGLALSTFLLVVLMRLLTFQSGRVFEAWFKGNPGGLFNYYGLVDSVASIVGVVISSLLFGRLVSRFGVGTMNLVFPSLTLLAVGAINFWPNLGTAIWGRLSDRTIKKVFRNPLEAMLFNSVPMQIKSQAKGFINAWMLPLGTLIAGLLVLTVSAGYISLLWLAGLGLALAVIYILVSLRIRTDYGRALVDLLADDELAIFRASHADFEEPDPATIRLLEQHLRESQDDSITICLAEMLYDFQGRKAFGLLQGLAEHRSPSVRAGVIQMLKDWIGDLRVRRMCLDRLRDRDPTVRRAAVLALAGEPDVAHDPTVLDAFLALIHHPDETIQASIIPPLMASGDARYHAPAERILSSWLADESSSQRRAVGLRVLARIGDKHLLSALARYASDAAPEVRCQAAAAIGSLAHKDTQHIGLETLCALLRDGDESVRLAAVNSLGRWRNMQASRALLTALSDISFEVRRQACAAMQVIPKPELEQALRSDEPYAAECAAYALARSHHPYARRRAIELAEALVTDVYALHACCLPLHEQNTPGANLMRITFQEQARLLLDRVFWLASAISGEQTAESIQRSLHSETALTRANAAETLETITSPRLAQLVSPLFEGADLPALTQVALDMLDLQRPSLWQVCQPAWPQLLTGGDPADVPFERSEWLAALSMYVLMEAMANGKTSDEQLPQDRIRQALEASAQADCPLPRETARLALSRQDVPGGRAATEESMTVIEKVIFLKQVPFFQDMNTDDLRVLAGISEETTYAIGEQILTEGERGDALYVIVSGRVGIQRRRHKPTDTTLASLATLGPRNYFAEMSLFDDEPHSADAVALTPTHLLVMRRAPLLALIKHQPDLAISLFKVLSQRLRQANAIIAERHHK